MDPRVTWYQPEQLGRATDLWTQIFDSATDDLQNFHVGDSMSKTGTGNPSPTSRSSAGRAAPDYIPLNGENVAPASKKKGANGYIYGDRQDTINKKRKDNLASTYDWNHSGKLRNGGTPWRMPGQRYSGIVGLHHEIIDFYYYMLPRHEEHLMRKEVVHRIQGIVRSIWPEAKVEIYGSYRTMLYLPTSDIDLVLFGEIGDCPFFRLGNELEKSGIAEPGSIKVLDKASVPIVKFKDDQTKVRVDISFNMRTGTNCAKLIEEFIQQFPSLPFLVFTLKQFLLQRDLNEVWTGGISSYSLILMIVSFLQLHAPPEPKNLGVLLIEFFELYGNNFNYFKTGISVTDGGSYFRKEDAQKKKLFGYRTSLLCIEDPLDPDLDLGKSSYGFMAVRQAFLYAFRVLCQGVLPHIDQEDEYESILGRIIRVTDEVVAYRQFIHQNWYHKVHPVTWPPSTMLSMQSMHYMQMVAMNQMSLPENTTLRIDNSGNFAHHHHPQQHHHQQHHRANNNNNQITNNNNELSVRTPTATTTTTTTTATTPTSTVVERQTAPAGQGTNEEKEESKPPTHLLQQQHHHQQQQQQQQQQQSPQQQNLQESCAVTTLPVSNESEAVSAGTLSLPSSQEDLSSCSDVDSEHSSPASVSSKDTADISAKDSPSPPPLPQGRHKTIAKAVVSMKTSSAMTPSIIVSSSTSQRTATPPIIKPSAVLSVSSTSTVTEAVSKPKTASRDCDQCAKTSVVITNVETIPPKSEPPVTTAAATAPSPAAKVPASTATVTSVSQPVTSRTYRSKSHQYQNSSKFRSGSGSNNNNTTMAGNGNASGGKRIKRKHKRDSQRDSQITTR